MESKTTHAYKSKTRDSENIVVLVRVDVLYKRKHTKVQIILEEDFIKQPFLKLHATLKGHTHGIKKPHADESRTRDFEKEIV